MMLESSKLMKARFATSIEELNNKQWMTIDVERTRELEDQKVRFIFLDEDVITSWYYHDHANVFHSLEYCEYVEIKELSNADDMGAGRSN